MFKAIKQIPVDRKNSLPVSDLQVRYRSTGTPVVFGDLTKHWPANTKWTPEYLAKVFAEREIPIYSEQLVLNHGDRFKPALQSSLSGYFELQQQPDNDFRVSRLTLNEVPELQQDFAYPRLGFDFFNHLSSLYVGTRGCVEPMRQTSRLAHTVYCHFGDRVSVLLVPPTQSALVYAIGRTQTTVRDIDYDQPQFAKYPALKGLNAYVAELDHGDSLYVPAGFWVCTRYEGTGITLALLSITGSLSDYLSTFGSQLAKRIGKLTESKSMDKNGFTRAEREAVVKTNARFLNALKRAKKRL